MHYCFRFPKCGNNKLSLYGAIASLVPQFERVYVFRASIYSCLTIKQTLFQQAVTKKQYQRTG